METQTLLSRHNKFTSADFPHIFYVKNNPHPLSLDTDWIF